MSKKGNTFADILFNSAFIHNPVLFQMVGLGAVVAVATTLKTALLLAAIFFPVMIITQTIACLFLKEVPRWIRVTLYLVIGTAIVAPAMYVIDRIDPGIRVGAGIYFGLTAVSSITALHCEKFAVKMDIKRSLFDAVACAVGYGVVIVIVGFFRELLGMSSIWGKPILLPFVFPALLMPFGGFIVLAFCAAAFKALINKRFPEYSQATLIKIKKTSVIVSKKNLPEELSAVEKPIVQAEEETATQETAEEPEAEEEAVAEQEISAEQEASAEEDTSIEEETSTETVYEDVFVEPVNENPEELELELLNETDDEEVFEPKEQNSEFEPIAPMEFEQETETADEGESIDDILETFEKRETPEAQANSDDDEFSSLLNHLFEMVEFDSKSTAQEKKSEDGEGEK